MCLDLGYDESIMTVPDDTGSTLRKVDHADYKWVPVQMLATVLWAVTTFFAVVAGLLVVKIEAKRAVKEMVKAGKLPGDMNIPLQFRRYARFCDSMVTTWPEPWWWQHSEQRERKLNRSEFDTMEEYWEANLYHWRAIRNPINYLKRAVPHEDDPADVVQTKKSYTELMFRVEFHHGDRYPTSDNHQQVYRWDTSRPWLGYWHRVHQFYNGIHLYRTELPETKTWWKGFDWIRRSARWVKSWRGERRWMYLNLRFGFKLAHQFIGMGFTTRIKYKPATSDEL